MYMWPNAKIGAVHPKEVGLTFPVEVGVMKHIFPYIQVNREDGTDDTFVAR